MQVVLTGVTKSNQLPVKQAVPFLQDAEFVLDLPHGGAAIVTADSPCLLAHLFYIILGEVLIERGRVTVGASLTQCADQDSASPDAPPLRPQDRGIAVLDGRSALWWDRSLLDNVAALVPEDTEGTAEAAALAQLAACGLEQALLSAQTREVWAGRIAAAHTDPEDRKLLLAATALIDEPADDILRKLATLLRPGHLPDGLTHKRVELARELVQRPGLLMVLDSCDCAGQPNAEGLYPLLRELAPAESGLLLFSRTQPAAWGFAETVYRFADGPDGISLERHAPEAYPAEAVSALAEDEIALRLSSLSKTYKLKDGPVIEAISLEVERGKVTVIMGGSGCGKSSLLRIVAGIQPPTGGQVLFNHRVEGLPTGLRVIVDPANRVRFPKRTRKAFGVLFQDGALFNSMTVAQNVSAPIIEHTNLHQNVIDLMVQIKLDLVTMWGDDPDRPDHAHKYPKDLSGGQKKRVGLARALALDPQVILYDEPSAGLDPIVSRDIDELIKNLGEVLGVTSVVVTHELDSAFDIGHKMVMLRKAHERENEYWGSSARMVAQGKPEEIRACIQPHVIAFLQREGYHHEMPLARFHTNWYTRTFESG